MIDINAYKAKLIELTSVIEYLEASISPMELEREIFELEQSSAHPNFWSDPINSQNVLQKIKRNKEKIEKIEKLKEGYDECAFLTEMYEEEPGDEVEESIKSTFSILSNHCENLRLLTLLNGEHDKKNVIVSIHPGAGGTEAQDWAEMLLRMYTRWAEKKGLKMTITDYLQGDVAGIKSVTFRLVGEYAYGYFKAESGVHRLVRISPFDSSGRRHTSFASLEVIPEISDEITIDIQTDDLRIDTYRASGAGGQHVNKTDSAIRITHIPTGVVAACQSERSQHQNKEYAMKLLMSKLVELKEREHMDKIDDLKGVQMKIEWGSQIRSYVFCPYTLVKDHRTNYEQGDVAKVMDGDIDGFINAYLLAKN